jgi:hypothetical protein
MILKCTNPICHQEGGCMFPQACPDDAKEPPATDAPPPIGPSVVYRKGAPTLQDYRDAIESLQRGMEQLEPNGDCCSVCGDTDHQAFECHHNPIIRARQHVHDCRTWRCYHCGFATSDHEKAREHFGPDEWTAPACQQAEKTDIRPIVPRIEGVTGDFSMVTGKLVCVKHKKYGLVELCFAEGWNIPFAEIRLHSRDLARDADAVFEDAGRLGDEIARRWNAAIPTGG